MSSGGGNLIKSGNVITLFMPGLTGAELTNVDNGYRPIQNVYAPVIAMNIGNGRFYFGYILIEKSGKTTVNAYSVYGASDSDIVDIKNTNFKIFGCVSWMVS